MSRKRYKYVIDLDGAGHVGAKHARLRNEERVVFEHREREGWRDLDQRVDKSRKLHHRTKPNKRAAPRVAVAELGHERMRRTLPEDQLRRGLSSRQKKERSKAKQRALSKMPKTETRALYRLTRNKDVWDDTNRQLVAAIGDATEVTDEKKRRQIRTIDRAIQSAEKENDRGHVVYANVKLPSAINHSNREKFLERLAVDGTGAVAFDRYTVASHQLHEAAEWMPDEGGRVITCEIQTRRGAYLGGSDRQDDTRHLLPRSMHLQVVGVRQVEYEAPDGTRGKRTVLQLADAGDTPQKSADEGATSK